MFQPVDSKANFPKLEERILAFWKNQHVFQKCLAVRSGAPHFSFYEGPPTANGRPGIHHVLSRIYKDVILRYKTMKGYSVPRKAGWDTHGLPVELEVEKKLGFSGKQQIEEFGVDRFNALCRDSVWTYLKDWEKMTERIAFWLDMEHPYVTMDNSYIESGWWAIKQLWDKGLIYQGYKVTPHCPRCGTSLSSHEVALGYKDDASDPSVFIKFKVTSSGNDIPKALRDIIAAPVPTYLMAWTTTPWTLPGNTALAVAPEAEYLFVEQDDKGGKKERLVLARARLEASITGNYRIVGTVYGEQLLNLRYEPLFNPGFYDIPVQKFVGRGLSELTSVFEPARMERPASGTAPESYPVISGSFVSMEDGTGIVHIAPAFGEIDFEVGQREGLYFVQHVDASGTINGSYPFAGRFAKKADPYINDMLAVEDRLYRSERLVHTYPFCWRCDTPLLYYAKQSWYIRTTAFKDKLISGNDLINWYPEHIKNGRFGDWLTNNVDWAFSRERYWGTPLPVWQCDNCGHNECIGSVSDIRCRLDSAAIKIAPYAMDECFKDLHRPSVDNIILTCPKCFSAMRRRPEVIDCWFDSGAMPFAQWHYPFENRRDFERDSQADFISEAIDQTRGWFYSLHALSTLLFEHPAFKNVICLGHILDAQGEKMSKTRGNVVDPWTVLDSSGADALRWYLYTSAPAGNVRRFSPQMVQETLRSFILTLWNTYSFFVMYANIDKFNPRTPSPQVVSDLDTWIISELNRLIVDVTKEMERYDPTTAVRRIEAFVDDLSNWYVRRSRRRFWKSENDTDKLAAHSTLYKCLATLTNIMAPFIPFIAEEMYQNLVRSFSPEALESVHMAEFPVADESRIHQRLSADTRLAIRISSLGRAARAKAHIKVRQPLAQAIIKVRTTDEKEALKRVCDQVMEELNVKSIEGTLSPYEANGTSYIEVTDGDYQVVIISELSPELEAEGTAREIVRRVQTMRRQAGYEVTDHIVIYYNGAPELGAVMTSHSAYIKRETLCTDIIDRPPESVDYQESFTVNRQSLYLGVRKIE